MKFFLINVYICIHTTLLAILKNVFLGIYEIFT